MKKETCKKIKELMKSRDKNTEIEIYVVYWERTYDNNGWVQWGMLEAFSTLEEAEKFMARQPDYNAWYKENFPEQYYMRFWYGIKMFKVEINKEV